MQKRKHDEGHVWTDAELEKLERRIAAEYKKAADELTDKINAYFESFKKRDEETKALIGTIVNGREYTEKDYQQWRLAQIGRGKRFEALRDRIAERMTHANEVAAAYINDKTPSIYSLNRNYSAYTIEKVAGDVGFDLWDEQTVKRLIVEQPDLMPYYPPKRAVKRGIDLAWGKRQITAQVTSGILQGESIKHLADRLQTNIPNMNRDSAIRAARTAVTGAQNAGRQDSYDSAVKMGIEMEKQWLATLDGRTRHDHAMADGQTVAEDKPFTVGGEKLMYPGDPSGSPWNVYNCRCTMIAKVKGVDMSDAKRRVRDPETGESVLIENMTYAEWAGWKEKQPAKPKFVPASTIQEAEQYAEKFVESYKTKYSGKVDYRGIELQFANEMNRALTDVLTQYEPKYKLRNITPFNTREKRFKDTTAEAAYQWGINDLFFNKSYMKTAKAMGEHVKQYTDLLDVVLPDIDTAIKQVNAQTGMGAAIQRRYLEALKATGRTNVYEPDAYGSMVHELGHYLDDTVFRAAYKESGFDLSGSFERFSGKISGYATSNQQEYIAESFAAYWKGETDILDPVLVKIFERSKKK